jgi:hypothetical protein
MPYFFGFCTAYLKPSNTCCHLLVGRQHSLFSTPFLHHQNTVPLLDREQQTILADQKNWAYLMPKILCPAARQYCAAGLACRVMNPAGQNLRIK